MPTSGQFTWIVIGPAELFALLVSVDDEIVAVLEIGPQVAALVAPVRVTTRVVPWVIVPKLQVMTPLAIEHCAAPEPLIAQLMPAGRLSVSTTFCELPVPPAVTVIV